MGRCPTPLERYPQDALDRYLSRCHPPRAARRLQPRARGGRGRRRLADLKAWPARTRAATEATYSTPYAGARWRAKTTPRASRAADSEAGGAALQGLGRAAALHSHRESSRLLSLHRRRLSLPARGGGSDTHVRRRRRTRAYQPPLPLPRARPRPAPLDGVRFDHALWRGPGHAAGRLRTYRQLGGIDRDAR